MNAAKENKKEEPFGTDNIKDKIMLKLLPERKSYVAKVTKVLGKKKKNGKENVKL